MVTSSARPRRSTDRTQERTGTINVFGRLPRGQKLPPELNSRLRAEIRRLLAHNLASVADVFKGDIRSVSGEEVATVFPDVDLLLRREPFVLGATQRTGSFHAERPAELQHSLETGETGFNVVRSMVRVDLLEQRRRARAEEVDDRLHRAGYDFRQAGVDRDMLIRSMERRRRTERSTKASVPNGNPAIMEREITPPDDTALETRHKLALDVFERLSQEQSTLRRASLNPLARGVLAHADNPAQALAQVEEILSSTLKSLGVEINDIDVEVERRLTSLLSVTIVSNDSQEGLGSRAADLLDGIRARFSTLKPATVLLILAAAAVAVAGVMHFIPKEAAPATASSPTKRNETITPAASRSGD